jgi:hypothetical protein
MCHVLLKMSWPRAQEYAFSLIVFFLSKKIITPISVYKNQSNTGHE